MTNLRRNYSSIPDLTPPHKDRISGVHGTGTAKIATTADITTHAALSTGVHGAGTGLIITSGNAVSVLGIQYALSCTYISGTGTAGTDNVAGTVKSVTIPANVLTQVGDRIRLRTYWKGDTGSPVTATAALNGVELATSQDVGAANFFVTENYLHYTSGTSANIIESGAYPATGTHSNNNVGGFAWASTQAFALMQNQVVDNHIVVYCMFVDALPKGVV